MAAWSAEACWRFLFFLFFFSSLYRDWLLKMHNAACSVNHVNVLFSRCTFICVQLGATLFPAESITLENALQRRRREEGEKNAIQPFCHTPLHHHQPITKQYSWGFVWPQAWSTSRCMSAKKKTMTPQRRRVRAARLHGCTAILPV